MEVSVSDDDSQWVRVEKNLASAEDGDGDLLKVEFFEPATFWTEALPLGNGKLGAMVFGGIPLDLIMLNDDTLYTGGPKDWNNPRARDLLPKVREAVREGKFSDATNLASQMLGPYCQVVKGSNGFVLISTNLSLYQPLGAIELELDDSHQRFDPDSYHRQLDLDTATVSVTYTVEDVTYTREYFTSNPQQVLAVRLSADKANSVSFAVTLLSPLQEGPSQTTANQILVRGRAPGDVVDSSVTGHGMAFAVALEVRVGGESGVLEAVDGQILRVQNADWALILLSTSTSFDGPFRSPLLADKDPSQQAIAALKGTEGLAFDALLKSHLNDYQPMFRRLKLRLAKSEIDVLQTEEFAENTVNTATGRSSPRADVEQARIQDSQEVTRPLGENEKTSGVNKGSRKGDAKISTRDRLEGFAEDQDPRMVTLLFQYGRYLMLASSRPGTMVSNLQGIWNKDLSPAWRCVPHININLPMNYWPAETCNLSECHGPLFDIVDTMTINGRITAKVNYGLEGWVGHHNVDIWGQTAPVGGDPVWALWPMGGAWLSLHLWEHYCFTLDKTFLSDRAYPVLKGCAQFLLGWLIEDTNGNLITNPSTSPEHYFVSPDTGNWASVAYASAMDLAIIRELFESLVQANQILGDKDVEFVSKIKITLDRLGPVKLAHDGCLLEWGEDFEDPEVNHRHMSHLFGLFPGHTITHLKTPELCHAAKKSMLKRGEIGPGWSMAWKNALWARLWNEEHAYRMVVRMFRLIGPQETTERYDGGGLYCNLFNAHPPFQIDGNFGGRLLIAGNISVPFNVLGFQGGSKDLSGGESIFRGAVSSSSGFGQESGFVPACKIRLSPLKNSNLKNFNFVFGIAFGLRFCRFTGAIAEMLLQSDGESLYLLPALPKTAWPFGKVEGLRGRGAATVSMVWEHGVLVEFSIDVDVKSPALKTVHYQERTVNISEVLPSHVYTYNKDLKLQHSRLKVNGFLRSDGNRAMTSVRRKLKQPLKETLFSKMQRQEKNRVIT
ncbi:hypothetical protein AXG93_2294s1120 [Marchantia polymorpha subsp. ruderalis]|uniref:Uncharacterized protein n=1 Tax=Marchantia polymorpha subsp. ruderalis TaxID=1480154 RepID=A0A176WEP4_MARPO|nr:hypothetical protein AXG93_2294s1120 [Marchantia polymorpha subsp. ruderalis]